MAATYGVWGIDIGRCALKALRCEYDEDNKILVATGFDYIEYPKILSQPDANPEELIDEALKQFMERNETRGDHVAMSVPGQNGLSRFFQPPPVDAKKLPDIVQFEARQQIPFPLDEVIWDYQQMGGGQEVDGFVMETEIGLFAMKRDQVFQAIAPFQKAELELHIVQLAPLSAYNFVAHNLLTKSMETEEYDSDNPPESFVILNVGTDTTDLVITNGFRVWQRNIPLGGNHFTKQLTKELKLTFANAEHLKRNVRESEDAKAVIQAMRPVFNDMLTEVQRSIGFFQNIDRKTEIAGMIMMGNAMKLPGLQQYLSKNLGYEIVNVDHECWAARLAGQSVLTSPQFKENMHAFGICYGLCLQGLGQAKLNTNLLPGEIVTERLVRAKKPWAVATAAALMLAFAVNYVFAYNQWYEVHETREVDGVSWQQAMSAVDGVQSQSGQFETEDSQRVAKLNKLVAIGKELSGNTDRRLLWLELLKAINRAMPQDPGVAPNEVPDPKDRPFVQRQDLHIEYVESEYFLELKDWFTDEIKKKYGMELQARASSGSAPADGEQPPVAVDPNSEAIIDPETGQEVVGPEGAGWVIELKGYHFFNGSLDTEGGRHVRNTLLKNLREQMIELPVGPGQQLEKFTMEELGIGYALLVSEPLIDRNYRIPNPYYEPPKKRPGGISGIGGGAELLGGTAPAADDKEEEPEEEEKEKSVPFYIAPRFDFVVQFCWQEKQLTDRLAEREQKLKEQREQEALENPQAVAEPPVTNTGA